MFPILGVGMGPLTLGTPNMACLQEEERTIMW